MNTKTILTELYKRKSSTIKLGLKNITLLLKKLNNPQHHFKSILIAGTNGKGSSAKYTSAILTQAGFKIGTYTSPHLIKFNERIRINNKKIPSKLIATLYKKIKPHITNQSFFEITTALAFLYFKQQKIDIAVLEVGLGGRLDATNTVKPLVSVITNIDYEHTNILGKTKKQIAYEKAGIIKHKTPVVTAATGEALKEIKRICKQKKSPLTVVKTKNKITQPLYQQKNIALTEAIVETVNQQCDISISSKTIHHAINNIQIEGRFQFIQKNVLLDCAHNAHAIQNLINELDNIETQQKNKTRKIIVVLALLRDKNHKKILDFIGAKAHTLILTKPNNERATDPYMLETYVKRKHKDTSVTTIQNSVQALKHAKQVQKKNKNSLIVVTGSLYLIGEILNHYKNKR